MRSFVSRWTSRWALPLLAAAMDAAWMTPYAFLLGAAWLRPGTAILSPLAVFALLGGAQALTREILARRTPLLRAQAMLAFAGAAGIGAVVAWQYGADPWWRTHGSFWQASDAALVAVRPELPALGLGALAWRRGIGVGRTALEYYDLEAIFHLGLAAFGVFAVSTALSQSLAPIAVTAWRAFPYLVGFFATSLVALPIARLRSVREHTHASESAITISSDWYAMLAGAVTLILGVALVAGAILRLDMGAMVQSVGRVADAVLWAVLYAVALPLGFIAAGIIWVMQHLLHLGAGQPPRPFTVPQWTSGLPNQGGPGLPPGAAKTLRWGIGVVIAILAVLWLARAVFRYERYGMAQAADEVHESVWSWADLRAAWRAWWQRRPRRTVAATVPLFGTGAAAIVRRAYGELLGVSAALGSPRAQSQTPAEFSRILCATWPESAEEVQTLTAVYTRVRYGLATPSDADLEVVRRSLGQVRERAPAGQERPADATRGGKDQTDPGWRRPARRDDGEQDGGRGGKSDA